MKDYRTAAYLFKLPELPTVPALRAPLERVLAMLRDGNGRTTTGSGAKRRSSYEHQLDRIDGLRFAARQPAGVALVERGHGKRRTEQPVPIGRLLHDPYGERSRAVVVYRKLIREGIAWLDANAPLEKHWARPLSVSRAMRSELASGYVLPRRSWPAFIVYRAVYDFLVSLIVVLERWWYGLIPSPRAVAPEPKAKEPQRTEETPGHYASRGEGITERSTGGVPEELRALLRRFGPPRAM